MQLGSATSTGDTCLSEPRMFHDSTGLRAQQKSRSGGAQQTQS